MKATNQNDRLASNKHLVSDIKNRKIGEKSKKRLILNDRVCHGRGTKSQARAGQAPLQRGNAAPDFFYQAQSNVPSHRVLVRGLPDRVSFEAVTPGMSQHAKNVKGEEEEEKVEEVDEKKKGKKKSIFLIFLLAGRNYESSRSW